ncbi:MAG: hypothetical protein SGPRY_014971, partial [Prymnesium sp.]
FRRLPPPPGGIPGIVSGLLVRERQKLRAQRLRAATAPSTLRPRKHLPPPTTLHHSTSSSSLLDLSPYSTPPNLMCLISVSKNSWTPLLRPPTASSRLVSKVRLEVVSGVLSQQELSTRSRGCLEGCETIRGFSAYRKTLQRGEESPTLKRKKNAFPASSPSAHDGKQKGFSSDTPLSPLSPGSPTRRSPAKSSRRSLESLLPSPEALMRGCSSEGIQREPSLTFKKSALTPLSIGTELAVSVVPVQ